MKKVMLAAMAVMVFGFSNAQKSVRFGIKGGFNISTVSGNYYANSEEKLGAHIGGLVEIKLTRKFSIQPELLLSLQGAKFDRSYGAGAYTENKLNLTYINVPVLAKFYVIPSLSLEAGPQVGFLVSAKDKVTSTHNFNDDPIVVVSRNTDVKDDFNTVEAGFNIGASYYFTNNLFTTARYTFGITSIDDRSYNYNDDDYYYNSNFDARNGVFQASFAYKF